METLRLAGDVGPLGAGGEVLVWTGTMARAGCDDRPNCPPVPNAINRAPRRTALQVALSAIGDESERALVRAAALRLKGDAERAASGQKVTQNWDPSLQVDGIRFGQSGGRAAEAVQASRRLEQVANHIGTEQLNLLYQLIIQERSLPALGYMLGLSGRKLLDALAKALMSLATAYKLRVASA